MTNPIRLKADKIRLTRRLARACARAGVVRLQTFAAGHCEHSRTFEWMQFREDRDKIRENSPAVATAL
jgi:hypothetical protein